MVCVCVWFVRGMCVCVWYVCVVCVLYVCVWHVCVVCVYVCVCYLKGLVEESLHSLR